MKTYVNKVDKCKRLKVNRKETTMKFSNLKVCPFCGSTTYYTKSYTTGVTRFNYNLTALKLIIQECMTILLQEKKVAIMNKHIVVIADRL